MKLPYVRDILIFAKSGIFAATRGCMKTYRRDSVVFELALFKKCSGLIYEEITSKLNCSTSSALNIPVTCLFSRYLCVSHVEKNRLSKFARLLYELNVLKEC